jgi:D-alanyl-lipoteichoic acid acyltransferase DltB (MBOAT superfamily)
MLFNSSQFAIFFPIVTLGYFWLPHRFRWQWLLVASCYFYAAFIPAFLAILGLSIAIDYVAGIAIEDAPRRWRRPALVVSILANVGLLAVFKYGAFAWENAAAVGQYCGMALPPLPSLILPIGLSFHTFQAMSYTIEVYRGTQKAERHPGIYALYVLFYPQLVAGPIERPQNLLHQFRDVHVFDYDRVREGLLRIVWGLVKKVVIADRLAIAADALFHDTASQRGLGPVLSIVCFAFQIYCDFSGYTDIALGCARIMGFNLMENFRQPYFAQSITDFWTRWHISLSTWFKDYVYIPLGGNRAGTSRWYANLFIVFLISGLWHGANWTYIVWGAYHGMLMILAVVLRGQVPLPAMCKVAGTFCLVCVGWVFFRAESLAKASEVFVHCASELWMIAAGERLTLGLDRLGVPAWEIGAAIAGLLAAEWYQVARHQSLYRRILAARWSVRWATYEIAFLLLVLAGKWGNKTFIYFQF